MQKCKGGECIYGRIECCTECEEKAICKETCGGERQNDECISRYEEDD